MTLEAQQIAIGKAFGHSMHDAHLRFPLKAIPDYIHSLDAIVPVVRSLPELERLSVLAKLKAITDSPEDALLATPAQWAEAFLRAKGLWQ